MNVSKQEGICVLRSTLYKMYIRSITLYSTLALEVEEGVGAMAAG